MLDMTRAYTASSHPGVAWRLLGYATMTEPVTTLADDDETWVETGEVETVEDPDRVRAVMVGDDRPHELDVADLTPLPEGGYCPGCGQTTCGHYR